MSHINPFAILAYLVLIFCIFTQNCPFTAYTFSSAFHIALICVAIYFSCQSCNLERTDIAEIAHNKGNSHQYHGKIERIKNISRCLFFNFISGYFCHISISKRLFKYLLQVSIQKNLKIFN